MITEMVDVGKAEILPSLAEGPLCCQSRQDGCRPGRVDSDSSDSPLARRSASGRRCSPVNRAPAACRDEGDSLERLAGRLSPDDREHLHELLASCGLDAAAVDAVPRGFSTRPAVPIGVARTDEFFAWLQSVGGVLSKTRLAADRERLIRRLAAADNVWCNRRAVIWGEQDFVVGTVSLLLEAGMLPTLCASPAAAEDLRAALEQMTPELPRQLAIFQADGVGPLETAILRSRPDVLIASREARRFSRQSRIPFVSAGSGVWATAAGEPILHIGYRGALQMLERIEAALLRRAS